jgi:GntR family transcriptional regulator
MTKQNKGPHYLRIYNSLKDRILKGELMPGTALPSQAALSREFNVQVMTLRHALELLQQEGFIELRHGVGTFVANNWIDYDLNELQSFDREMAQQGQTLQTQLISAGQVAFNKEIARELALAGAEELFLLERLRLIGTEPVVYQLSYLPLELGQRLKPEGLAGGSLYQKLTGELGLEIGSASERIYAVALSSQVAALLKQRRGAPGLLAERVTYDTANTPLVFDRAFMTGHRMRLNLQRAPGIQHTAFSYELLPPSAGQTSTSPDNLLPEEGTN